MTDYTMVTEELSLQEMLADPIVQTMMTRDGVKKQDIEDLIETVRDRNACMQMTENKTRYHESSPIAFEG